MREPFANQHVTMTCPKCGARPELREHLVRFGHHYGDTRLLEDGDEPEFLTVSCFRCGARLGEYAPLDAATAPAVA